MSLLPDQRKMMAEIMSGQRTCAGCDRFLSLDEAELAVNSGLPDLLCGACRDGGRIADLTAERDRLQRELAELWALIKTASIVHRGEEGPNARWIDCPDPDGSPNGYFEDDWRCTSDCPSCAIENALNPALEQTLHSDKGATE